MRARFVFRYAVLVCPVWFAASGVSAAESPSVDFSRQIRPLLSRNCFACHGPDEEHREGGLRLDQREAAVKPVDSGKTALVPGKPEASELIRRITSADADEKMPPPNSGHDLAPDEIELFKRWVAQGAEYSPHWAFVAPKRPALPVAPAASRLANEIDVFVAAELARHGLPQSPEADKYTLIRRLSLDLRGLPPTPAEVDEFIADTRPDAYERLTDRMLADPAFGERWARMWLDLARYADSAGYGSDPLRLNIWRYRDWVIEAFNANKPYDQFTVEQLAGDLLPNATVEQKIATAFHRNTMTNTEGGTDDEEFRTMAVWDRVDTTMQVWMGVTMGCAKCHSHKYDPITQQEYYRVFAIFNQTADRDAGDESPTMSAPDFAYLLKSSKIEADIAAVKQALDKHTPELAAGQLAWERSLEAKAEWKPLTPKVAQSKGGATLTIRDDGSILASGPRAEKDAYTIEFEGSLAGVAALRLEAIPDSSLPGGGSGRADDGNFVLSRITVTTKPIDADSKTASGRFVRIEKPGAAQFLHLAEVQVFSAGQNIAAKGKATQSTTAFDGPPELAIDGNTNGQYFESKSVTHTAQQNDPWWEVDLGAIVPIERMTIWNRTDGGTGARMTNLRVLILDAERKPVWQNDLAEPPNPSRELSPTNERSVEFANAFADHSQDKFAVGEALTGKKTSETGWAVGPKMKEPHFAIFVVKAPSAEAEPRKLIVTLDHQFKMPGYSLGHFRLSATTDPNIGKRAAVPNEQLAIVDTPADKRSPEQISKLAAYFRTQTPSLKAERDKLAALEKARPAMPTIPVMQELSDSQRRKTNILLRGNFLTRGEEVQAGLPSSLSAMRTDAAPNRLTAAQWIVSPENPLTARVAVNRFWAQLFGAGLVETEEDFGSQGEMPSNQQLLDWMATELLADDWNMKQTLRRMVTSTTYRQVARVTTELLQKDPRNRLLSRGPRFRLEAELVRDQALAIGGLLSRKLNGPSVYPYQPPNMWQAAFNGQRSWTTSDGEDKYRRGLYVFWRRTVPYPSMATFDAPSREVCLTRRIRTNTPLQAFVTLNDPVYVEASQALARRILLEGGATASDKAAFAVKLVLSRPADPAQLDEIVKLYETELSSYQKNADAAKQLATMPLGPLPTALNEAEAAAWTVVANMLLNLDAVLMKG